MTVCWLVLAVLALALCVGVCAMDEGTKGSISSSSGVGDHTLKPNHCSTPSSAYWEGKNLSAEGNLAEYRKQMDAFLPTATFLQPLNGVLECDSVAFFMLAADESGLLHLNQSPSQFADFISYQMEWDNKCVILMIAEKDKGQASKVKVFKDVTQIIMPAGAELTSFAAFFRVLGKSTTLDNLFLLVHSHGGSGALGLGEGNNILTRQQMDFVFADYMATVSKRPDTIVFVVHACFASSMLQDEKTQVKFSNEGTAGVVEEEYNSICCCCKGLEEVSVNAKDKQAFLMPHNNKDPCQGEEKIRVCAGSAGTHTVLHHDSYRLGSCGGACKPSPHSSSSSSSSSSGKAPQKSVDVPDRHPFIRDWKCFTNFVGIASASATSCRGKFFADGIEELSYDATWLDFARQIYDPWNRGTPDVEFTVVDPSSHYVRRYGGKSGTLSYSHDSTNTPSVFVTPRGFLVDHVRKFFCYWADHQHPLCDDKTKQYPDPKRSGLNLARRSDERKLELATAAGVGVKRRKFKRKPEKRALQQQQLRNRDKNDKTKLLMALWDRTHGVIEVAVKGQTVFKSKVHWDEYDAEDDAEAVYNAIARRWLCTEGKMTKVEGSYTYLPEFNVATFPTQKAAATACHQLRLMLRPGLLVDA